jgi:hypothetical protein
MERTWPDEAIDFEAAVSAALHRLGGTALARRCEADLGARTAVLLPVVADLDLLDLDIHGTAVEAAAAARAARAAGRVVCPWPLVQTLAVPAALRSSFDALYLGDGSVRRLEHLDLTRRALCLDVMSRVAQVVSHDGVVRPMPLDPFGVSCALEEEVLVPFADLFDGYVVLVAFWVAGALSYVRDLAAQHASERRQFGKRISEFGGVQWRLADIAIAHDSLWELASFSLARFIDGRLAPSDGLALLYTILESARSAIDNGHQVLAAIGLCAEHDLTLVERHLQPLVRRSGGLLRVLGLLSDEIHRSGFDNLYPVKPMAKVDAAVATLSSAGAQ